MPAELPRIKDRKAYLAGLADNDSLGDDQLPDWRITCFFVDRTHRRSGVAAAALAEITRLGGGTVESHPEDVTGRKVSAAFLHNGTLALVEAHGFHPTRRIGKHRWVVRRRIDRS